jgi:hypothetical protein
MFLLTSGYEVSNSYTTSAPCPYRTPFGRQHSSGEHRDQDAGDHKGPPVPALPPSPLRMLMGFSLG